MKYRIIIRGDAKQSGIVTSAKASISETAVAEALEKGAEILKKAAQAKVASKAKQHPRGLLVQSIAYKTTTGALYSKSSMGWKKTRIKASTRGGGKRSVSTVDDYARILEYSSTRQLRHMEEAYNENEEAAYDAIQAALDAAIDKIDL